VVIEAPASIGSQYFNYSKNFLRTAMSRGFKMAEETIASKYWTRERRSHLKLSSMAY
jgi:hypothetical protein